MSQDARRDEEAATQRRARLLGLAYVDTSKVAQKTLYKNFLSLGEMYKERIVPIQADKSNIIFGITNTTSQQSINTIGQRLNDYRTSFALMSDSGYREYMRLYDPPKQITYQDISFAASTKPEDLISQLSATLAEVRPDDILAYLVQQAYRLKASDIHLENQKADVRIRFRVDGVLHPIAALPRDKYHHLLSAIASAANVSTDVPDAQTGHINKAYRLATGEDVTVNPRVEP